MRTFLAICVVLMGISAARADQLPIINGAGASANMNVVPDGSGAFSSRVVVCDATNPDTCAPVVPTITSVVSTSAESSHVIKASAGNLYSVYATNLTGTAGFLIVLNATSVPADGAVSPLACSPLPANSFGAINYGVGPPQVFSTGIVAVVTSAASCFTKTTGTLTAFIAGRTQ